MSFFSDLLPDPTKAWKAPIEMFKRREGQPFLQGSARNFSHATFGDKVASGFEQRFLGDPAPGTNGPQGAQAAQMSAQIQPQAGIQQQQANPLIALMQQMMKQRQGGQ